MRTVFWAAMLAVGFGASGCAYVPPSASNPGYFAPAAVWYRFRSMWRHSHTITRRTITPRIITGRIITAGIITGIDRALAALRLVAEQQGLQRAGELLA